jgi:hypothetical protein
MAKGQRADVRGAVKSEREFHRKWEERQRQKVARQKHETEKTKDHSGIRSVGRSN